jgi:hypothetical protein
LFSATVSVRATGHDRLACAQRESVFIHAARCPGSVAKGISVVLAASNGNARCAEAIIVRIARSAAPVIADAGQARTLSAALSVRRARCGGVAWSIGSSLVFCFLFGRRARPRRLPSFCSENRRESDDEVEQSRACGGGDRNFGCRVGLRQEGRRRASERGLHARVGDHGDRSGKARLQGTKLLQRTRRMQNGQPFVQRSERLQGPRRMQHVMTETAAGALAAYCSSFSASWGA